MTTLYMAPHRFGMASPSDDIAEVSWIDVHKLSNFDGVRTMIMPEHRDMMIKFIDKVYNNNLIPNIGGRLAEREGVTYTCE